MTADGPWRGAFSIMMVSTRGKQFAVGELFDLLHEVGFENCHVQQAYGYYSLISARRP
jgi:hypothetical protein